MHPVFRYQVLIFVGLGLLAYLGSEVVDFFSIPTNPLEEDPGFNAIFMLLPIWLGLVVVAWSVMYTMLASFLKAKFSFKSKVVHVVSWGFFLLVYYPVWQLLYNEIRFIK